MPASSRSAPRPSWRSAPSRPTTSTCASPGLPLLGELRRSAGLVAAAVGIVFGLPSLRLRGFYLAVSTLAAQFFVQWALTKFGWFSNDNPSGVIDAPPLAVARPRPRRRRSAATCSRWRRRGADLRSPARLVAHADRAQLHRRARQRDRRARSSACRCSRTKLLAFAIAPSSSASPASLWAFAYLRHRRAGRLRPRPLVPDPVHHHHRRPRHHPRRVPRRRADRGLPAAAVAASATLLLGGAFDSGVLEMSQQHRARRADHRLPDRRAARAWRALCDVGSRRGSPEPGRSGADAATVDPPTTPRRHRP